MRFDNSHPHLTSPAATVRREEDVPSGGSLVPVRPPRLGVRVGAGSQLMPQAVAALPTARRWPAGPGSHRGSGCARVCAHQIVLPTVVCRVPHPWVSWATSRRPRPPSSKARARRRCGAVLLASETSQIREVSRMSRSLIGGSPYLMALVTSSLTTSSVTNDVSSSPQASNWSRANFPARGTCAGSG